MVDFIIREYRDDDLPALAQHWRESERGWPPGEFTGWDFSPEAIHRMLFRQKHIAVWIAVLGSKIIGYMTYNAHYDEPSARYISLLNAHPDYHGIGVGRDLLRTAVNCAVEDGAKRLDLHTWAANMKAVPLYKKTGFFWRTGTEVHMYNFLPTVLRNPYVKRFLGNADWYAHMRQDLSIEENNAVIDGCHIQRYIFEKDGGRLEVRVDPSTSGITALIGDDLQVRCDVPGEKHMAGFSYPVKWYFNNRMDKPANISLNCRGNESIDYEYHEQIELRDEASFDTAAKLNASIKPLRWDWWGIPIICDLEIDDIALEFRPGLRAMPPFELEPMPGPVYLAPGDEKEFTFNLKSHSSTPVTFHPRVETRGAVALALPYETGTMAIPPEGGIGLTCRLKAANDEGIGAVNIGGGVVAGNQECAIEPLVAYARVVAKGIPVGINDNNPKKAYLANGTLYARIDCEKGVVQLTDQATGEPIISIHSYAIGEPYSQEMGSIGHSLTIDEGKTGTVATLRAASRDFPGIIIEQHFRLGTGTEIEIGATLINDGDNPLRCGVKLSFSHFTFRNIVAPLTTGLVKGDIRLWLSGNANLPEEPSAYLEPWLAFEGDDRLTGLAIEAFDRISFSVWSGSPQLEWRDINLAPSARVELPKVTIIADAPNIDCIRQVASGDAPIKLSPPARYMMRPRFPLFAPSTESCRFEFHLARKAPVKGTGEVILPDDKTYRASKEDWNIYDPICVNVPLTGLQPGIARLGYKIRGMEMEISGDAPLVVLPPTSDINITETDEGGYKTFTVDNGCYKFKVSPTYCGTLWWWSESRDDAENLLMTPFPETGHFTWLRPWYGGIGFLSWEIGYRFHRSGFNGQPDEMDIFGLRWKGVRVDISLLRWLSTLKMELFYLTLPGAPVILNLLRFTETGGARRSLPGAGIIFPRPGGVQQKATTASVCLDGIPVYIDESTMGGDHKGRLWASVSDAATRRTIGLIAPRGDVILWDQADEGRVPCWEYPIKTSPDHPTLYALFYCLADTPEHIPLLADEFQFWEP